MVGAQRSGHWHLFCSGSLVLIDIKLPPHVATMTPDVNVASGVDLTLDITLLAYDLMKEQLPLFIDPVDAEDRLACTGASQGVCCHVTGIPYLYAIDRMIKSLLASECSSLKIHNTGEVPVMVTETGSDSGGSVS